MPPGPAFNWLCVLHSAAEILGHAARYRVAQSPLKPASSPRKRRREDEPVPTPLPHTDEATACSPQKLDDGSYRNFTLPQQLPVSKWDSEMLQPVNGPVANSLFEDEKQLLRPNCIEEERPTQVSNIQLVLWRPSYLLIICIAGCYHTFATDHKTRGRSQPQVIKSTFFSDWQVISLWRLACRYADFINHLLITQQLYPGLAVSLGYGAATELMRRTAPGSADKSSIVMTEANIKRLVTKLVQMRGAALKLGQFMSIQGTKFPLAPQIEFSVPHLL